MQEISFYNILPTPSHNKKLLAAVSGGVDSMVLCELLVKQNLPFAIAHCNFNLRGEESNGDAIFVKDYAAVNNIDFYSATFDTKSYALHNKVSTQVAARELRYAWFEELLSTGKFSHLLTAHHANDNAETILMNLAKGTGIKGLTGIAQKTYNIIRPLLKTTRKQIEQYAAENNVAFREDSSNSSDNYTRNYFRHNVISAIEKEFPHFLNNMQKNVDRFKDVELLYNMQVDKLIKGLLDKKGKEYFIPALKLEKAPAKQTIIYELFKNFGFGPNQVKELEKLLNSPSGKYIYSTTHRVLKDRKFLIVSPLNFTIPETLIIVDEGVDEVVIPTGTLKISTGNTTEILPEQNCVQLNSKNIQFPLTVRKWKTGDYFYPLGMPKKKKLSRFFIDNKLSQFQKENIYVIESNKKIIWIIGHRIDDRFKVMPSTKTVLKIKWQPNNLPS